MNAEHPLKAILVIVLTGTALGIGSNLLHPQPLPWVAQKPKTVTIEELGTAAKTGEETPAEPPADPVPDLKPMKDRFEETSAVPKDPPAPDLYTDIPASELPIEVRLAKTQEFYDRGGLLVLDARDRESYDQGHIRGAVYANAEEVIADYEWMEATAADPRPLLIYCDGGECELSMDLGLEMARLGHQKVLVYMDGYPAWKDAGYPTSTGEQP